MNSKAKKEKTWGTNESDFSSKLIEIMNEEPRTNIVKIPGSVYSRDKPDLWGFYRGRPFVCESKRISIIGAKRAMVFKDLWTDGQRRCLQAMWEADECEGFVGSAVAVDNGGRAPIVVWVSYPNIEHLETFNAAAFRSLIETRVHVTHVALTTLGGISVSEDQITSLLLAGRNYDGVPHQVEPGC